MEIVLFFVGEYVWDFAMNGGQCPNFREFMKTFHFLCQITVIPLKPLSNNAKID
jgi:hypothetical protein